MGRAARLAAGALALLGLGAGCASRPGASGNGQDKAAGGEPPTYVTVRCIRTPGGKGDAYRDYMLSTTAKTMQVRADEGNISGWIFARANLPGSGEATACDFLQMNFNRGFPPARTPIDPYFVKAGVQTTRQEWYARLGEMTKLVWVELWRGVEGVGRVRKGNFLRIDLLKVHPTAAADWRDLQTRLWRPAFQQALQAGLVTGFTADELLLPAGTNHPYQARRMIAVSDWDAVGRLLSVEADGSLVRQGVSGRAPSLLAREARASVLARSALYEVVEAVWPAAAATPGPPAGAGEN